MDCENLTYDNRETCTTLLPSSCIPYVGYISPSIQEDITCRPNINDIIKALQELIVKSSLGDNTTLTNECLTFTPATVTQSQLNQIFITELCNIKQQLADLPTTIDPNTINIAIDLLCLIDPSCTPQTTYTLTEILIKLVTAYCNLLTRVQNIENILNI